MVRLVCELGMQLQMRQCDCNGTAVCTFRAAVIGVCLGRYALSAVWFFGTYPVCFMRLYSWIAVSGFLFERPVVDDL